MCRIGIIRLVFQSEGFFCEGLKGGRVEEVWEGDDGVGLEFVSCLLDEGWGLKGVLVLVDYVLELLALGWVVCGCSSRCGICGIHLHFVDCL
jgi:hypothetical protein